ncbi:hypothetical protein ACOSQ3_029272 [Xanthoceras sorbifolium]
MPIDSTSTPLIVLQIVEIIALKASRFTSLWAISCPTKLIESFSLPTACRSSEISSTGPSSSVNDINSHRREILSKSITKKQGKTKKRRGKTRSKAHKNIHGGWGQHA